MNIFSHIWKKHFRKGTDPLKLVEDVGDMKGIFSYKEYNPITGQILNTHQQDNLLVNQSKSNIIRLISQGQSPWIGNVNPENLKIARMRFGNAENHSTPNRLYYYDPSQLSSRKAIPVFQPGESTKRFAGGLRDQEEVETGLANNFSATIPDAHQTGNYELGLNNTKKYTIPESVEHPPSHGTLIVKLFKNGLPVEEIWFENEVYTRVRNGILPTKIITNSEDAETRVSTPNSRPIDDKEITTITTEDTQTRLVYDYDVDSRGWKFLIDEIDKENARFDYIEFTFDIGKYNIVNSIVPQTGYNQNITGANWNELKQLAPQRFQGNTDYYNIISTEYRDAEIDYVDDFSVTFSVNMAGHLGNGNTDAANEQYIRYKEAFLFNQRSQDGGGAKDDLFSAVWLPTSFDKNATSAFFISWTILSPLN